MIESKKLHKKKWERPKIKIVNIRETNSGSAQPETFEDLAYEYVPS